MTQPIPPMVERVARRIARADGSRTTGPGRHKAADEGCSPFPEIRWTKYEDDNWQRYVHHAYSAIEAMREPTPDMLSAGDDHPMADDVPGTWRAMISAALGEKPE